MKLSIILTIIILVLANLLIATLGRIKELKEGIDILKNNNQSQKLEIANLKVLLEKKVSEKKEMSKELKELKNFFKYDGTEQA